MTNANVKRTKRFKVHDDLERILDAARLHGEISEPDHEVGDLITVLRIVWPFVPKDARRDILKEWPIKDLIDFWGPDSEQAHAKIIPSIHVPVRRPKR